MANDYKDTLFLPQTDFPMRANLAQREPSFLQAWDESGVYERLMAERSDKPLFILSSLTLLPTILFTFLIISYLLVNNIL